MLFLNGKKKDIFQVSPLNKYVLFTKTLIFVFLDAPAAAPAAKKVEEEEEEEDDDMGFGLFD